MLLEHLAHGNSIIGIEPSKKPSFISASPMYDGGLNGCLCIKG